MQLRFEFESMRVIIYSRTKNIEVVNKFCVREMFIVLLKCSALIFEERNKKTLENSSMNLNYTYFAHEANGRIDKHASAATLTEDRF